MSVDRLDSPGAYVLIVKLDKPKRIAVGRLGRIDFHAGTYAYVGSAMGGLAGRLGRHVDPDRRTHWHVDRLMKVGTIKGAFVVPSKRKEECVVATTLAGLKGVERSYDGFGCSDCGCVTHLFSVDGSALRAMRGLYGEMIPAQGLIRRSRRR